MISDSVARAAPWNYPCHPANAGNRARVAALVFNLEAERAAAQDLLDRLGRGLDNLEVCADRLPAPWQTVMTRSSWLARLYSAEAVAKDDPDGAVALRGIRAMIDRVTYGG